MLKEAATVIAIPQAYADTFTLETVAEPNNIVYSDFEEMTDKALRLFCPVDEIPTCRFFYCLKIGIIVGYLSFVIEISKRPKFTSNDYIAFVMCFLSFKVYYVIFSIKATVTGIRSLGK